MSYLPNPDDERIFWLDICQYEPHLNLDMVAKFNAPKCHGGIFRIGGSKAVEDTMFSTYWPWAKRAGLKRSIYMYNWPGWTVDENVSNFMRMIEKHNVEDLGDGPIWVDAECHADKSRAEVSNHTWGCISGIAQATGKQVGCYSAAWFLNGYMEIQDWMAEIPWWWAQWYYNQNAEYPAATNWNAIIPEENRWWHQTGSCCDASIFGGRDRVDTDRWHNTVEKYNEVYGDEAPPPSNEIGEILDRLDSLEGRVDRHLQE
jgi:hypothetical protein